MKSALSFASCCLVALGLSACDEARNNAEATGSTFCFTCHSETSALGIKIKWAEAGYDESVHAHGQVERDYAQTLSGGCPPFIQPTAAACTAQGGTHSGAANGNVCTMPGSATKTTCDAAAGAVRWNPPVVDITAANGVNTGPCPQFNQATAAAGTAQACPAGGGTFTAGTFTCDTAGITTQNGCETAGGVWVGPKYTLAGTEKAGSNAFYANSGGCQMCHTQEGFRKRISKQYDPADGSYTIQYSWDTRAQVGSPSSPFATPPVANTPLTADVILNPSPIGCFGCHTPHSVGSVDNVTLDQAIPVGTAVTTQTGAVWGNATTPQNKAKGHICAECHQVRLNNQPSVSASIVANVKGTGKFAVSAPYGPHHGPQTDMILGFGGAQYSGTANAGAFTFNGTYANSPHTTNPNADCISCHMQNDFSDINVTGSFGVSPAVGGHSFTNKGIVHGAEKVLAVGCGSVTDAIGCHTVAGVTGSSGTQVRAANFAQTFGYLQEGDAYFQKSTSATSMVDSNYQFRVNELLTKLANPSADCTGLLQSGAVAAGGALSWVTMLDGVTIDPRCISNGTTTGINKSATAVDDNSDASVRLLKGLWNFKFALVEDKSFGVHNTRYALELLYDSCVDLALLTGRTCGSNPGRCSFCEGTYVTTRP